MYYIYENQNNQRKTTMRLTVQLFLLSILVIACGTNQQKADKNDAINKDKSAVKPTTPAAAASEFGMWKIASYASNLGDNRNTYYITNSYAIWGTFTNSSNDKAELKVKFLVDKDTFCMKLLAYGRNPIKKGDENSYKIKIKSSTGDLLELTAKNVSDRLFITGVDSPKIVDLFNKGGLLTFFLVTDSKTDPATFIFNIDNPEGFSDAMKKLSTAGTN